MPIRGPANNGSIGILKYRFRLRPHQQRDFVFDLGLYSRANALGFTDEIDPRRFLASSFTPRKNVYRCDAESVVPRASPHGTSAIHNAATCMAKNVIQLLIEYGALYLRRKYLVDSRCKRCRGFDRNRTAIIDAERIGDQLRKHRYIVGAKRRSQLSIELQERISVDVLVFPQVTRLANSRILCRQAATREQC